MSEYVSKHEHIEQNSHHVEVVSELSDFSTDLSLEISKKEAEINRKTRIFKDR